MRKAKNWGRVWTMNINMNYFKRYLINLVLIWSMGCATLPVAHVGEGPLLGKVKEEETKILAQVRQEIQLLEKKGAIYSDQALENYLNEVGRRVIPPERMAAEVTYRFRIVRDPTLNAFACPTGDIFIHMGLLARLRTEGELISILGHELSHVYQRDTLQRFLDAKQKTVAWKVTDLLLTPAFSVFGIGGISEWGLVLVYATSVTGYGREQEARADIDGVKQMVAAGYDPYEGIHAMERFLEEEKKYRRGMEIFFLASHPNTRWRKAEIEKWLKSQNILPSSVPSENSIYRNITADLREENARVNLQMGRYYHALDDLDPILKEGHESAKAVTLSGGAYRRMAEDTNVVKEELSSKAWKELALKEKELKVQWREKAQAAYHRALELDPQYPEAHLELGMLLVAEAKLPEAIGHLETYLVLSPEAKDRRFVTSQLQRLTKQKDKEGLSP